MNMVETKVCKECSEEININEYNKNGKYFKSKCKRCEHIRIKNWCNERIKNHLCISCKKLIEINNNSIHCLKCLKIKRELSKIRDAELIKNNQCRSCANQIKNTNATYCSKCLENRRHQDKTRVINFLCRRCLKPIESNNNTTCCLKCSKSRSVRRKNRYEEDINYKIREVISTSICNALRNNSSSKNGESCLKYLPFTIDQLIEHLEKQFEPWMNWENHGSYRIDSWDDNNRGTWVWHIDHIIPTIFFNYTSMKDENFKKCWALENLRPLSAKENIIKGAKIIKENNK